MDVSDRRTFLRHQTERTAIGEILLTMLVFASMGAITWAIRGTSGWGGIDGTIVPGMTWGVLWWYVCWRKGIDARGVPLWLGLGIALGGELGYGQYVSWIRGLFNVGDEILPVAPWIGYAWFAICGVGWAAPGGIALGWALADRKSLGVWLARLVIPVGVALLARLAVRTWPWLFFPNWDLDLYVANADGGFDPAAAANTQINMIVLWLASASLCALAWFVATRTRISTWLTVPMNHETQGLASPQSGSNTAGRVIPPGWAARGAFLCTVGTAIVLLLLVAEWLFFPRDQLSLFAGELDRHLGRTVYTNSQNAIVFGWWIGALVVAAIGRDRYTLFAGLVLGLGFGIGFPTAALWCLGYAYSPNVIDWWKMWELHSGFYLGLLYVAVLYWAIRQVDENREASRDDATAGQWQWFETVSMVLGAFLAVYVMARDAFMTVGILLGSLYVGALFQATRNTQEVVDQRRGVSFVYSVFLLVFIMAWGVSSQLGILLGLYQANAVDQYAWPPARIAIFAPVGLLIVGAAMLTMWQVFRNPRVALPPRSNAPRISARLVDLMTFTGVVGATSIWPAKIGVFYALFLGLALFAFNRLNCRFDNVDALQPQGD